MSLNTGTLIVETLKLRVRAPISTLQPAELKIQGEDPSSAFKGEREIWRGTEKVLTKVFQWDKLQPGNIIKGPAAIEGIDTTYIVPRGWDFRMDTFLNGCLIRRG